MQTTTIVLATAMLMTTAAPVLAQEAPAAEAPPAPPALSPALAGPLTYNPDPINFDVPLLGKLYVTAIGSGLVGTQSNSTPGVSSSFADISNAQVIVQKPEGVFQFLVQAGLYNQETLGLPFLKSTEFTDRTYGPIPQAWIKIAPSSSFSVQAGILPTLIGLEAPFTFQNMNIDRGMLWGQENVLTRAVQGNLTLGKLALSLSYGDGFFSGKWNWISGLATYTFNSSNALTFVAGGPINQTLRSSFATGPVYNNSTIYDLIYSFNSGPVLIQPYFQYTRVNRLRIDDGTGGSFRLGRTETLSGAILARYTFNEHFAVPVRFEYIDSRGDDATSPSVLYGTESNAFSFAITPTYTYKRFFARPEFSVVSVSKLTPGFGFSDDGNARSQVRGRLEVGFIF